MKLLKTLFLSFVLFGSILLFVNCKDNGINFTSERTLSEEELSSLGMLEVQDINADDYQNLNDIIRNNDDYDDLDGLIQDTNISDILLNNEACDIFQAPDFASLPEPQKELIQIRNVNGLIESVDSAKISHIPSQLVIKNANYISHISGISGDLTINANYVRMITGVSGRLSGFFNKIDKISGFPGNSTCIGTNFLGEISGVHGDIVILNTSGTVQTINHVRGISGHLTLIGFEVRKRSGISGTLTIIEL